MNRIESLAAAIMKHEGFYPGSRSWRNKNPGNLRASVFANSVNDGFAAFYTFDLGWRALIWDLEHKCWGQTSTGLNQTSTLADLITVWAPVGDHNNTQAYIQDVCHYLGLEPTTPLNYFIQ